MKFAVKKKQKAQDYQLKNKKNEIYKKFRSIFYAK